MRLRRYIHTIHERNIVVHTRKMRLGELLGGRAVILCALTPDFAAADFARTHPLPPVSVPTPLQQELLPKAIAMLSDEVP